MGKRQTGGSECILMQLHWTSVLRESAEFNVQLDSYRVFVNKVQLWNKQFKVAFTVCTDICSLWSQLCLPVSARTFAVCDHSHVFQCLWSQLSSSVCTDICGLWSQLYLPVSARTFAVCDHNCLPVSAQTYDVCDHSYGFHWLHGHLRPVLCVSKSLKFSFFFRKQFDFCQMFLNLLILFKLSRKIAKPVNPLPPCRIRVTDALEKCIHEQIPINT
jgi:hypothetical protein